jgi:hypothetical protein
MPRVRIGPALPDHRKLEVEIARLRDLDVKKLRGRFWQKGLDFRCLWSVSVTMPIRAG